MRLVKTLAALALIVIVRKQSRSPEGYRSTADGRRIWQTQISP